MPKALTPDEEEYVKRAMISGAVQSFEMLFIISFHRIQRLEEPQSLFDIQTMFTEIKVGLNQVKFELQTMGLI